ncbi:OmpA family protein [Aureisphaera galaxeae]|uniref:OmpA family protein n=1 Tax=Aureisphaera galaxeae TaxID=1538023 RepID=UPI00234FDFAD|nr:OmpA family protein [Aureisphaera galaxeae]MDC8003665.1 OmpA family protein [Aureisphaera galaxeae]
MQFETKLDSLAEEIDFHYHTGKLKNDKELFQEIAEEILNSDYETVSVEAHTDSRGYMKDNFILSEEVAEKVKHLLVQFGVPLEDIKTMGWAESRPRGCVMNPKSNYEWNRRVEIILE